MTTLPTVVNRHWYRKQEPPSEAMYIGRGTPLGNPYRLGSNSVRAALSLYRRWLWDKIRQRDRAVVSKMREITPDTLLMCSCKPRPCHGDVVVAAWAWMRDEGLL